MEIKLNPDLDAIDSAVWSGQEDSVAVLVERSEGSFATHVYQFECFRDGDFITREPTGFVGSVIAGPVSNYIVRKKMTPAVRVSTVVERVCCPNDDPSVWDVYLMDVRKIERATGSSQAESLVS